MSKIKFNAPWGNGEISGALGMVSFSLAQLEHIQKSGSSPIPDELAWQIDFMKWVVSGGEGRGQQYLERRFDDQGVPRDRREFAKDMGYAL